MQFNMGQFRPPRQPRFVTPRSPAPWDVVAALGEMEKDAYNALIKEPAEAAGIPLPPEVPGPAAISSMVVGPLQQVFGGLTQGNLGGGLTKRGTITEDTRPPALAGAARRGSL